MYLLAQNHIALLAEFHVAWFVARWESGKLLWLLSPTEKDGNFLAKKYFCDDEKSSCNWKRLWSIREPKGKWEAGVTWSRLDGGTKLWTIEDRLERYTVFGVKTFVSNIMSYIWHILYSKGWMCNFCLLFLYSFRKQRSDIFVWITMNNSKSIFYFN